MEQRQMRLIFSKTGNIRFISHLDMTRAFLRAFKRSEVSLKMSEGFSPHPKISFPLPLSVGMESENEILDFSLNENETKSAEEIKKRMNENLPDGITVKKIYIAAKKSQAISFAEYVITIPEFPRPCGIGKMFTSPVFVTKKTKKGGEREIDITEGIKEIEFIDKDGDLVINAELTASGENYLNPELVVKGIKRKYPEMPEYYSIVRKRALTEDQTEFI